MRFSPKSRNRILPVIPVIGLAAIFLFSGRESLNSSLDIGDVHRRTQESPLLVKAHEAVIYGKEEEIIPINDRKDPEKLKYAAFGSSRTYGVGLPNRTKQAYVKLLGQDNGVNYAIRASGPNYPASCLTTMIGDEEYDVIILEYLMRANTGLAPLARRIRQRFPDSLIIITRIWYPYLFWNTKMYSEKRNSLIGLGEFIRDNGFNSSFIHDPNFHAAIRKTPDAWELHPNVKRQYPVQERIAEEVGAYIVYFPLTEKRDGPDGWIQLADILFAGDSFHLSIEGHKAIADGVQKVVDRVGIHKDSRVGPFGLTDRCYNWLMDGDIGEGVTWGTNGHIVKMPNTEKYALQFDAADEERETYISITNDNNQEMDLNIGYMATGPAPTKYPKTEATLENGKRIVLDPVVTGYNKEVHVSNIAPLGTLPPKKSTRVYFRPLEESEWPFRVVQVMVTPTTDNDMERWNDPAVSLLYQ